MLKFLKFFGMEPVVVREMESGLLVVFLSLFGLLAVHTVGLSIVIHFNRMATEAETAVPAPPALDTLNCKNKDGDNNKGALCR